MGLQPGPVQGSDWEINFVATWILMLVVVTPPPFIYCIDFMLQNMSEGVELLIWKRPTNTHIHTCSSEVLVSTLSPDC